MEFVIILSPPFTNVKTGDKTFMITITLDFDWFMITITLDFVT